MFYKFGSDVTVKHKVVGAYDPVEGTVNNTIEETVFNGVVVAITQDNFPGAMIQQGDKLLYIDGACDLADTVLVGGTEYQVIMLNPVDPSSAALIVTKVQIRK